MDRRTLLVATGVSFSAALAGCLGSNGPASDDDHDDDLGSDDTDDGDDDDHEDDDDVADGTDGEDDDDPGDDRDVIEEDPRTDEPPHDIEIPEQPTDPEDFDQWDDDYLGSAMETEPTLEFDVLTRSPGVLRDPGFDEPHDSIYRVQAITSQTAYEEVFDEEAADDELRERLNAVDFEETALVVVESGIGSGSIEHRFARVDEDGAIAHLHGYYSAPFEQTDDLAVRHTVLEVEKPADGLEFVRTSLTVGEDRRVHFNSTEGVVVLEE